MKNININSLTIGLNKRPIIIAEMSANHNNSLDRALKIVEHAAKCGADIIKLQTYTPETMTLNIKTKDFIINDKKSLWHKKSLYDLYSIGSTPWEWHRAIFKKAKEKNITCISTPFDETAVDFLEKLNSPAYKIASFENTDALLLKKVARTMKPIILSTGMASLQELSDAVKIIQNEGNNNLILLKCTSTYPAKAKDSNISTIPYMQKIFNCHVGLSDHTHGIGTSIAAVANGARIIEKHFTLSRKDGGIDSKFSLEPNEFKILVKESKQAFKSIGKIHFGPTLNEKPSLKYRRSLYVSEDVKKGQIINRKNIKNIRPGYGLPSKYIDFIIGKKFSKNLKKGTALNWDLIS